MPIRHALLALLGEAPAHGYQLKQAFESRTGGSWELNIGQVYSTLRRLERDGLVAAEDLDDDRIVHHLTDAGRATIDAWFVTPIVPVPPPRDELAIKVLLAISSPQVDERAVMQHQRRAVLQHLQVLTRQKARLDPDADLAELLHLDALLLRSEAEIRWLDTCEARLRHRQAPGPTFAPEASEPERADTAVTPAEQIHRSDHDDQDPTNEPHGSATQGGRP